MGKIPIRLVYNFEQQLKSVRLFSHVLRLNLVSIERATHAINGTIC
jgi:hypothetical protein